MQILIAVSAIALTATLVGVTVLAIVRGDTVELTFHPPIFIKIKITRTLKPGLEVEFGNVTPSEPNHELTKPNE